jgi:hypothetical protein
MQTSLPHSLAEQLCRPPTRTKQDPRQPETRLPTYTPLEPAPNKAQNSPASA